MDITFIITCKGRLHHLKEALPLFLKENPDEIIVVDYGCPDGTADWLAANAPVVKVVKFESPTFNLSHARNLGAEKAKSKWLCFVDADIIVKPGWIEWLKKNMKMNRYYRNNNYRGDHGTCGTVICPRPAFESIGGYDKVISSWGGEDKDLYIRLEHSGVSVDYFPGNFLSAIEHDDTERTQFYDQLDKQTQRKINIMYRDIKSLVQVDRGGGELPLETRQSMYDELHTQSGSKKPLPSRIELTISPPDASSTNKSCTYVFTKRRQYWICGPRRWFISKKRQKKA